METDAGAQGRMMEYNAGIEEEEDAGAEEEEE